MVCADGGADTALSAGLTVEAVIGDMDSASAAAKTAYGAVLHPIAEQNSTDFDKCLRNIEAPAILGVGFLGDRVDHTLAVLHVLQKYRRPIVLLGADDLVFMVPDQVRFDAVLGQRVSLMPVTDSIVTSRGLKWEVTDAPMSMRDFIGSSNEATAQVVEVRATPGMAVIMPPEALGSVWAELTGGVPAR